MVDKKRKRKKEGRDIGMLFLYSCHNCHAPRRAGALWSVGVGARLTRINYDKKAPIKHGI